MKGTSGFMEMLGMRPGRPRASLTGLSEFGGGVLTACSRHWGCSTLGTARGHRRHVDGHEEEGLAYAPQRFALRILMKACEEVLRKLRHSSHRTSPRLLVNRG